MSGMLQSNIGPTIILGSIYEKLNLLHVVIPMYDIVSHLITFKVFVHLSVRPKRLTLESYMACIGT